MIAKFAPRRIGTIYLLGILILRTLPCSADEILMHNGDRFTGTLKRMENGVITFKTDYSPSIEIRISEIETIITDGKVELRLSSGETLKGRIRTRADGRISVAPSDQRTEILVENGTITAINPPPVRWEGGITLAGNMQRGNTDTLGSAAAANGMKRTENDRLSLSYLFNYAEEEDHITARNHFGAMKYDYFYLKYIYGYLGLDVLNDRFRDIRMRTSIGPGVGYQIWEDSVKALGLEIGLSYLSESHYDNEDSDSWAMRLAGNLRYHMGSYLVITDQIVFYPTLEGNESNRVRNEATINAPLKAGWSMRCSHILDYSTSTPDDVKKTDTTVILGFQYQF